MHLKFWRTNTFKRSSLYCFKEKLESDKNPFTLKKKKNIFTNIYYALKNITARARDIGAAGSGCLNLSLYQICYTEHWVQYEISKILIYSNTEYTG